VARPTWDKVVRVWSVVVAAAVEVLECVVVGDFDVNAVACERYRMGTSSALHVGWESER
jgi:hypothetical protein